MKLRERKPGTSPTRLPIFAAALALLLPRLQAQCDEDVLQPSASMGLDMFGQSMAIHGQTAVIAAPTTSITATASGAVFVFRKQGNAWLEQQVLTSGDPHPSQEFGKALALWGDTLMVQAVRQSPALPGGSGVYIFERQGGVWQAIQRLYDPMSASTDSFGTTLAIEDGRAFISNVFRRRIEVYDNMGGTWVKTDEITEADLAPFSTQPGFAGNIAVEGNRVVLAHFASSAVHIFEEDGTGWHAVAELDSTPPGLFDNPPVAIATNTVCLGFEALGNASGAVYMFEEIGSMWLNTQIVMANDSAPFSRFGHSLASDGAKFAVGAPSDDELLQNAGAVYVLERVGSRWEQQVKARAEQPVFGINLGYSIGFAENTVFAGAPDGGAAGGQASVFVISAPLGVAYGDVEANSSGSMASLIAKGSTVVDHNCLALETTGLPAGRFGYFLMSLTQGFVPLFGGSAGNLHLAVPIVRFSGDILLSDAAGEVSFTPDLANLPQGTVFQSGETWNFQMWFRDVDPGPTSNTSNGLAITFATTGDPAVQFPATLLEIEEEATQFSIPITLSQRAEQDVVIPYSTGGTATYSVDWRVEELNPITIPAGSISVQMTIVVAEDAGHEANETGVVTLGVPSGGVLGTASQFTLTIIDDD